MLEKTVQNTKLSKNLRKQPLLFVYTFLQMYGKVRRKHFVCSIMGNVDKLVKTQKSLQKPAIFCQKPLHRRLNSWRTPGGLQEGDAWADRGTPLVDTFFLALPKGWGGLPHL